MIDNVKEILKKLSKEGLRKIVIKNIPNPVLGLKEEEVTSVFTITVDSAPLVISAGISMRTLHSVGMTETVEMKGASISIIQSPHFLQRQLLQWHPPLLRLFYQEPTGPTSDFKQRSFLKWSREGEDSTKTEIKTEEDKKRMWKIQQQ